MCVREIERVRSDIPALKSLDSHVAYHTYSYVSTYKLDLLKLSLNDLENCFFLDVNQNLLLPLHNVYY